MTNRFFKFFNSPTGSDRPEAVASRHSEQIQRIKLKLITARQSDKDLRVFGAESHQYRIDLPVSESQVSDFEKRYSVALPECYRAFLTSLGNGGPSYSGSAAGPYYGIYPLGQGVDEIAERPGSHLSRPAVLSPATTDQEWQELTARTRVDDEISDEEYERARDRISGGLLPIGSQGCSGIHALVLNGPHAGRVVNFDIDLQAPRFAFEMNFLDWYERWLDEVIAGYLTQGDVTWFGFTMGGDDEHLMQVYAEANSRETKLEAIKGLAKLATASDGTCRKLLAICGEEDAQIRREALGMLTKFSYSMARQYLHAHILSDDEDCLAACQYLFWYAKQHSKEWADLLRTRLPKVHEAEVFQFMSYLLLASGVDFSEDFRPFCTHVDENIRATAFHSLGKLKNKHSLVDFFIVGLDDASAKVVYAALQALEGVHDQRLIKVYDRVSDRFKKDENAVLTNLKHRMKEMGRII